MLLIKLIALIIIIYLIDYVLKKKKEKIDEKKHKLIKINKKNKIINYKDIFDILFNIEGYYYYNHQAYLDLLKHTETFLEIYELIKIDNHYATNLNDNLVDLKKEIMNTLISFEISLPSEYNLTDIINDYSKTLDKYLYEVYLLHEDYIKKNGIDYTIKLIHDVTHEHPVPYNNDHNIVDPTRHTYFDRC